MIYIPGNESDFTNDRIENSSIEKVLSHLTSWTSWPTTKTLQRLNDILKKVTVHDEVYEKDIIKIFHTSADQYIDGIIKESLKDDIEYQRIYAYTSTASRIREDYLEHIAHYERKEFDWKNLSPEFIAEIWKIIKENTDKERDEISLHEQKVIKEMQRNIDKTQLKFKEKIEAFCLYFDDLVGLESHVRWAGYLSEVEYKDIFDNAWTSKFWWVDWQDWEKDIIEKIVKEKVWYNNWSDNKTNTFLEGNAEKDNKIN